jgi:hypothetical protein
MSTPAEAAAVVDDLSLSMFPHARMKALAIQKLRERAPKNFEV